MQRLLARSRRGWLAALGGLAVLGAANVVTASFTGPFTGAIYTSEKNGEKVNRNIYDAKGDVYLNGGPQGPNGSGLPPGEYYFQVTDPSGSTLLSTDPASCRKLRVALNSAERGVVSGAIGDCPHENGTFNPANGSTPVKLAPFADTPNKGGVYKVWLIPVHEATIDLADARKLNFEPRWAKTDNFKVRNDEEDPDDEEPPVGIIVGCSNFEECTDSGVCYQEMSEPDLIQAANVTVDGLDPAPSDTVTFSVDGNPITFPHQFAEGTTGVTVKVVRGDQEAECEFDVTIEDCEKPEIEKGKIEACYDDLVEVEAAALEATTATDNCGEPILSVSIDDEDLCEVLVTVTATDGAGNSDSVVYTTRVDIDAPEIKDPDDVEVCLESVNGTEISLTATALDNCSGSVPVTAERSDGKALTAPYPLGTTTVTWTAADECGNTAVAETVVTVVGGSISGVKFYDRNFNQVTDQLNLPGGEPGIPGWRIQLAGKDSKGNTVGPLLATTSSTGAYSFTNLPTGDYTVEELFPNTSWFATTPHSYIDELKCEQFNPTGVNFGNLCLLPLPNGRTIGFWGNNNGNAILRANDNAWRDMLNRLNLRRADGKEFDISLKDPVTTALTTFNSWLQNANATNMAYMLSAQLAATRLNVAYNGLGGNTTFIIPPYLTTRSGANIATCIGKSELTINELIGLANTSLGAHGNTTAAGPARTYQECLKDLLDIINNRNDISQVLPGQSPLISGVPCPFTYNP